MSRTQVRNPVEVKIATVVAVAIILRDSDISVITGAMREVTGGADDYFDGEFAVIDVGSLDPATPAVDWSALIALLKSCKLNPVAVRNAHPDMQSAIVAHGLSLESVVSPRQTATAAVAPETAETTQLDLLDMAPAASAPVEIKAEPAPVEARTPAPAAVASPPAKPGSMIVDTPVRAGQRVYARGCDLVVTAAVNNGAEIIADGSIHVYAPLRGRALAGASGDAKARIFALSMEAELVSIAGTYRTFESGLPKELARKMVQVSLDGDRIDLHCMNP